MSEELTELDQLTESDILEALGEEVPEATAELSTEDSEILEDNEDILKDEVLETIEDISIEDLAEESTDTPPVSLDDSDITTNEEKENEAIEDDITIEDIEEIPEIQSSTNATKECNTTTLNSTDLASLLSQLLNNKTIEITIKIKD